MAKMSAKSRPVLPRDWLQSDLLTEKEARSTVQAMSPIFAGCKADNVPRLLASCVNNSDLRLVRKCVKVRCNMGIYLFQVSFSNYANIFF